MQVGKIFISGANRGLGKELLCLLRKEHPQVELHISSRAEVNTFSEDLKKENLGEHLQLYRLNLMEEQSILQNAKLIQNQGLIFNTIVANAAYGADYGQVVPSYEVAYNTITTNTIRTIRFIKQFLPSLAHNGRIVIVSSYIGALVGPGALSPHPQHLIKALQNPAITEEQIIKISQDFIECAKNKDIKDYSKSAYCTSKALINSWARFILPKYLKADQTYVCLHPGWCATDMGGQGAPLTSQEGGRRINEGIWLQKVDHSQFYNQKFCSYETCQ